MIPRLSNFDPVKVGDEIAALEAEAQSEWKTAQDVYLSRSEIIAAKLWDVHQHHPEHLDAVCKRAKIGTSRRYELLQIGGGRKTIAQSRQETAERQAKFKAKKKAKQLAAHEVTKTDSITTPKGNGKVTAQPTTSKGTAKPKPIKSSQALEEIKQLCRHWIPLVPLLNKTDRREAMTFLQEILEQGETS
jgi:hypothetical protein